MLATPAGITFGRPHARTLGGETTLHVCVMLSNPIRYYSRYELLQAFRSQTEGAHVELWLVEVAYGDRAFHLEEHDHHLRIRTNHELWHKENALNVLFQYVVQRVPDASYFAWVDADISFARADWAYETLQQLQHYDVVQMFSHALDLGPKHAPMALPAPKIHGGFVWAYYNDPDFLATPQKRFGYSSAGHPGFAWAARRSALDAVGGLIDFAIVGGADRHMACGLIGTIERSGPHHKATLDTLSPVFRDMLYSWQHRALKLNKNIGYVDGLLTHCWHGKKKDRKYGDRWRIYLENRYNPLADLRRDMQGLYLLDECKVGLRDDLRNYLRARDEDSIDE
jgi:hypothetical protein